VSKFPRIINVGNISIRNYENGPPGVTITAQCTATTFVLLDKPNPAARKPGTIQRPGTPAAKAPAAQ
jgi:hypothetical protein